MVDLAAPHAALHRLIFAICIGAPRDQQELPSYAKSFRRRLGKVCNEVG
jgi:hypothetical protein